MKPGSSARCKSKHGGYRCHRAHDHTGQHSAPAGSTQVWWS